MPPPPYYISLEQRQLHCFKDDSWKHYRLLPVLKYSSLTYPGLKNKVNFELNPKDNQVPNVKAILRIRVMWVIRLGRIEADSTTCLQITSFISNALWSTAGFGGQRLALGINTNPAAKLGCCWIFFPMRTLSTCSQIQVNFNNVAFTNHSLRIAFQTCNILP